MCQGHPQQLESLDPFELDPNHRSQRSRDRPKLDRASPGAATISPRAHATGMVLEHVDLKTAQTRLGHSDPRLTLAVYAQTTMTFPRPARSVGKSYP